LERKARGKQSFYNFLLINTYFFCNRITGIMKLDYANNAGGRNAKDCILILTEGASVKSLAVAGLGKIIMEFSHSEENY
jgi:hypothetical protein